MWTRAQLVRCPVAIRCPMEARGRPARPWLWPKMCIRDSYAGVAHVMESDPLTALHKAGAGPVENGGGQADGGDRGPAGARVADPENEVRVDVIGNYTAFAQLLGESAET